MTDIILTFVPFLAAVAFFIRARGEQKQRIQAERRAAELERVAARDDLYRQAWLAALAHELRSPLTALLGYSELLDEGTLGTLDARGQDAITRIRSVADQMLHITDGLDRPEPITDTAQARTMPAAEMIATAVESLRLDAEARQVDLNVEHVDALLHTRPADASRAFELALGAAIKSSPGHPLTLAAEPGAVPALLILHCRLDPRRDDPAIILENTPDGEAPRLTGAALRIGMGRAIAEIALRGRLRLSATPDGCTVRLELPRLD